MLGSIGCKQEEPSIAAKDYPQEMASTYCEAVYGCQCAAYPYDDFNECFAELSFAYDQVNDDAYLAGLSYDGTCPAKELDQVGALGCKSSAPEVSTNICLPPCKTWHGSFSAGSLCSVVASSAELGIEFSNCAQGLSCVGGVCVNPCQLVGSLPGIGEPCPEFVCEAGAICDENQICAVPPVLPGPGELCLNGVCDPERAVCVADVNVCAALPSIGQMCVQGLCDTSSYCGAENVCLPRPPLACGLL